MKRFALIKNGLLVTCLSGVIPAHGAILGLVDSLNYRQQSIIESVRRLSHEDVLRLLPRFIQVSPTVAFTIPCIPPVGAWQYNRLSSGFGWRIHPIDGQYKNHQGVDIAGPHQYVRSAASGRVIKTGYDQGLGYFVVIDHLNSYQTIYGHLALITCQAAQAIRIGERIGVLGRTGRTTGLHLHYAVKKSGQYLNPNEYMTIGLKIVAQYQVVQQKRISRAATGEDNK